MAMQVIESSFQVSLADASAHNVHGGTLDDWEASSAGACAPAPGALETSSGSRGEAKLSEEEEGEGELPPLTFSEEDERRAEELKADGNEALKNGRYQRAEELYSEAIALVSTGKNSHIYFACVHLPSFPWRGDPPAAHSHPPDSHTSPCHEQQPRCSSHERQEQQQGFYGLPGGRAGVREAECGVCQGVGQGGERAAGPGAPRRGCGGL